MWFLCGLPTSIVKTSFESICDWKSKAFLQEGTKSSSLIIIRMIWSKFHCYIFHRFLKLRMPAQPSVMPPSEAPASKSPIPNDFCVNLLIRHLHFYLSAWNFHQETLLNPTLLSWFNPDLILDGEFWILAK